MKKILTVLLVLVLVFTLASCRDSGSATDTGASDTGSHAGASDGSDDSGDAGDTTDSDTGSSDDGGDPNADDPAFEHTGDAEEDVTISPVSSAPTIVVDLGELVTLNVFSEYLQDAHLWNEDLYVDATVARGEEVVIEIEANEEGIFEIVDKNQDDMLVVKFIVAGTSFT